MSQKTTAEDELVRSKSIGVPLTKADSEKLSELANRGKPPAGSHSAFA